MSNLILISIVLATFFLGRKFKLGDDFLGLRPGTLRMLDLLVGFVASAVACVICFGVLIWDMGAEVNKNPYSLFIFLNASWWTLRSVLIEELAFRGVLLVIGIRYLGIHRACIISSVLFGIYHWGNYGVFGDVPRMAEIFVLTGVGGLMFAYAFAYTRSFYLPVGLHLGWNLVSVVVFSEGPLGMQWLELIPEREPGMVVSILVFIYQITLLPYVTLLYLRNRKQLIY